MFQVAKWINYSQEKNFVLEFESLVWKKSN